MDDFHVTMGISVTIFFMMSPHYLIVHFIFPLTPCTGFGVHVPGLKVYYLRDEENNYSQPDLRKNPSTMLLPYFFKVVGEGALQ